MITAMTTTAIKLVMATPMATVIPLRLMMTVSPCTLDDGDDDDDDDDDDDEDEEMMVVMLVIAASHDVGDADDDGDEDEENKTNSACDAAEDDDTVTCECNHVHRTCYCVHSKCWQLPK